MENVIRWATQHVQAGEQSSNCATLIEQGGRGREREREREKERERAG